MHDGTHYGYAHQQVIKALDTLENEEHGNLWRRFRIAWKDHLSNVDPAKHLDERLSAEFAKVVEACESDRGEVPLGPAWQTLKGLATSLEAATNPGQFQDPDA